MARARKAIAADIEAANGTKLAPEDYSAKQLEELLELAEDQTAFEARLNELNEAAVEDEDTITVKVNDKIAAYGGAFTDPESKKSIGAEPVAVPRTSFVSAKLRSRELVAVEE